MKVKKRKVRYDGQEIEVNSNITNFTGNYYANVTIGATYDNYMLVWLNARGSLHHFLHIPVIDFNDETFENVGSFTWEQLNELTIAMKHEEVSEVFAFYGNSMKMPYTFWSEWYHEDVIKEYF